MKHYKILLLLIVTSLLYSCREDNPAILNPQDQKALKTWNDIFESFWNGMNYSYAFWDVDPTDWDKVYKEYKPRFEALEMKNSKDSITATELFTEITENLIDHHYVLLLYRTDPSEASGKSIWWGIKPGDNEIRERKYYHEPFSMKELANTIATNMRKGRIRDLKYGTSEGSQGMSTYSYNIDNGIIYLYLSAFNLQANLNNPDIMNTIENYLELVAETPNLKGIIIDTRGNGGGFLVDMNVIISPLISKETVAGYTKSKNGMGRLDYTPWSPVIIYPDPDFIDRDIDNIPIVALADINSLSMGEMTPMAICSLPNGCLIGERTGGGHGPLNNNFNDSYVGNFENDALRVYTSTSVFKNIDGNIYEGIGLTPDIEALYNKVEFLKGNDTQLERAIQYINTGR
ncbi:S41 family peptidase [Parabacteroides sp.]